MPDHQINTHSTQLIALTPGEPAGIGPDIAVMLAQQARDEKIVAIADPALLEARATQLALPFRTHIFDGSATQNAGELSIIPVNLATAATCNKLDTRNARYVIDTLKRAHDGCISGEFAAVVTGPVQKSVINQAGIAFSGHTEFFQEQSGISKVVMMLATPGLRVALATTHLPLKDVSGAITQASLNEVITILLKDLSSKFGINRPRVLVCGLNPHAGEAGHLGTEEITTINPVLERFRQQGYNIVGSLPADTLFKPSYLDEADAVLAMYHDQGLPVLKHKGFGNAVNITLGLPYVRTSVDHGTALDLAGTGNIDLGSTHLAISEAAALASQSNKS